MPRHLPRPLAARRPVHAESLEPRTLLSARVIDVYDPVTHANATGMVYDALRNRLYVPTNSSTVLLRISVRERRRDAGQRAVPFRSGRQVDERARQRAIGGIERCAGLVKSAREKNLHPRS